MSAPKRFKPGDRIRVTNRDSFRFGLTGTITGLSPSTRQRRVGGQWRWVVRLDVNDYLNENDMELFDDDTHPGAASTVIDSARLLASSYCELEYAPDELVHELEILVQAVAELESHLEHLRRVGNYVYIEVVEVET